MSSSVVGYWQCRVTWMKTWKVEERTNQIDWVCRWNCTNWFKLVTSIIQFKWLISKNQIKRAIHFQILTLLVMILKSTCNDGWNRAFRNFESVKPLRRIMIQIVTLERVHESFELDQNFRACSRIISDRDLGARSAILFYFILFYFILFYFILFYFILFYFILFYFILFYFILLLNNEIKWN